MENGLIIWACEGTKSGHDRLVEVVNSDAGIIRLFLDWLRRQEIDEERLKARITCHPSQLRKAEKYWSGITNIPLSRFTKPILKSGRYKGGKHSVTIRYGSKKLFGRIKQQAKDNGLLRFP